MPGRWREGRGELERFAVVEVERVRVINLEDVTAGGLDGRRGDLLFVRQFDRLVAARLGLRTRRRCFDLIATHIPAGAQVRERLLHRLLLGVDLQHQLARRDRLDDDALLRVHVDGLAVRGDGVLSLAIASKAVTQLDEVLRVLRLSLRKRVIALSGFGEPTLAEKLRSFILQRPNVHRASTSAATIPGARSVLRFSTQAGDLQLLERHPVVRVDADVTRDSHRLLGDDARRQLGVFQQPAGGRQREGPP